MGAYETPDYEVVVLALPQSTCSGQPGGAVQFQLMNGCAPYTYAWSNGASSGTGTTDLFPGTYVFTITDALGKTGEALVTIPGVPAVEATMTALPYDCSTGSNGSASVTTTGGTAPFEYAWDDGTTNASLVNLLPGDYSVTVTDANGCTLVDSVSIGTEGSLQLGVNISPITCHGDSDGTATVQPLGGTMPFTWLWASGDDTPMVDSLAGGSYFVTVTDALGCKGELDFTMNPPSEVGVSIEAVQPACFWNFGSATASATGGTGSFGYAWDNGAMTATILVPAGVYSVTATDEHGCTGTASVLITAPSAIQADIVAQPPVLCFGASNGTLAILPSGGTPPYDWSGPTENLPAGSYEVTITDSNGCLGYAEANIGEHPEIAVTETVTDASSPTASDGSIVLEEVTGGTGSGYTFQWSNGTTSQNLIGVPMGDYSLTVTDSQGCTASFSFFVDFETATGEVLSNPFGATIVPNPSGSGGARLVLDSAVSSLSIRIFDAQGQLVASDELTASEYTLPKGLAAGTYWVVLSEGEKFGVGMGGGAVMG
ncbi:MAG: T9SS type A sorting domain-containing protein [Saprospiraceae bacterium]|nr:T9SS type A sorting domain-containing protein [Saprospiraceae bacterium]